MKITNNGKQITVNHTTVTEADGKRLSNRRIVFLNDVVIKFDTGSCGWERQCEGEALTYKYIRPNDKKYFATVRASGEGWIVMDRVHFYHINSDNVTSEQYTKAKRTLRRLEDKYNLTDIHDGNYGIDKNTGKLIFFDYLSRDRWEY